MTNLQYRRAIDSLELTHAAAAELWGVTVRHEFRFASGDTPVPPAIAKLIKLAIAGKITLEDIRGA